MVRSSNIGIFWFFFIKVFLMYYIFTIEPTRVAKGKTKTAGTAPNRTEAAANRLKAARTAQNLDEMNNEDERINDEINDDEISFLGGQYKILISYFIFIVILHFYYIHN